MQSRMQTSNEVKDVIKDWIKKGAEDVHVSMIGKIESYNPFTNRASITPVGSFTAPDWQEIPYPTIHNVPLQFPCGNGGQSGVTFPVKSGDTCVIIFADHQIENFLSGEKSDDMELCAKVYQTPNKFGEMVDMPSKNCKELIISIVDLMSLVLFEPPKSDITVGDVQSFGIGLNLA